MNSNKPRTHPASEPGFSLLEVVIAAAVLSLIVGSIMGVMQTTQTTFIENQYIVNMNLRAQMAMDRLIHMASQALTTDAEFGTLKPTTGVDAHCMRFRLIQSVDPSTGNVTYHPSKVYLYGPDSDTNPCKGLIVGRGSSLDAIFAGGKGTDGFLGTQDDNVNFLENGIPMVELLVPSTFAPRTGEMFTVNVEPAPTGRLITFTIRLNTRGSNGNFILPEDLELTERVALWQ
jgi:prepilin-type N-terminal cleavage/methylation domain-containing protein